MTDLRILMACFTPQLENKQQQELFSTGKNIEPNVIKLNDTTFALIKDSQSVFVETDGNLLVKNAVKWTEMPLAVGNIKRIKLLVRVN